MFFIVKFNQKIFLPSVNLDRNVKKKILSNVLSTFEGNRIGLFGILIFVIKFNKNWKKGKILTGSSFVLYNTFYKAVAFKIFRGEILDSVLIYTTQLGFFCESGPLQIFISKQFIPNDYCYDFTNKCFYCSTRQNDELKKNMIIRIKIIGIRQDFGCTQAIGSISEIYLGKKPKKIAVHEN